MRPFAIFLGLCGICFGQSGTGHLSTRQVSQGACSVNASNVRGNVSVTVSGRACGNLSRADLALIRELVELLREDIDARRSRPASDDGVYANASGLAVPGESALGPLGLPIIVSAGAITSDSLKRALGLAPGLIDASNLLTFAMPGAAAAYGTLALHQPIDPTLVSTSYGSISGLTGGRSDGLLQPAGFILPSSASATPTVESALSARSQLGGRVLGSAGQPFSYQNTPDVTGGHSGGLLQTADFILPSNVSALPAGMPALSVGSLLGGGVLGSTGQPFSYQNVSDTAGSGSDGLLQTAGFVLPSFALPSNVSALPAGMSALSVGSLLGGGVLGSMGQSFSYRNVSDITGGGSDGLLQTAGFILPSNASAAPTVGSTLSGNSVPGRSLVVAGVVQPFAYDSIPNITVTGHPIDLPPPGPTGDTVLAGAWSSVSLTFASSPVGTSYTISGKDYASLSKSLSELSSGDHNVITGWTLIYLADKPR